MRMCECWKTCLFTRIGDCSGLKAEMNDRCNAELDEDDEKYKRTVNPSKIEVLLYFRDEPKYPHKPNNIFVGADEND